jgi:hypothetical protein
MDEAEHYTNTILGSQDHAGFLDLIADKKDAVLVLKDFRSLHLDSVKALEHRNRLQTCFQDLASKQVFYSVYQQKEISFQPRLVMTHKEIPDFLQSDSKIFVVKVPAVQQRMQDMKAIAEKEINLYEQDYGLSNVVLSAEAAHRLNDHTWDDCALELDEEIRHALDLLAKEKQTNYALPNILQSRHMLTDSVSESVRRRLLYDFPVLRTIIQSPWVFDHTLRYIVIPAFVITLLALFLGPQTREHNTALTYFWAGWWPIVMITYPLLGRIWCAICPFMAVGNVAQDLVVAAGVDLKKWPKWPAKYGAFFAFALFFAILMWEELWQLPNSGVQSAYLLLLITSGAVFNMIQFENRVWCRYLCPIGAMCRVFGTASMIEVRSWKSNCEGCRYPICSKPGKSSAVQPSDKFALKGCTMQLKNNQLRDMGDVSQQT